MRNIKKLSLILPAYNEESIIEDTLRTALDFAEKSFPDDYEIIFVNDGSSDATHEILSNFVSENVKIISYEKNMGKGYAVRRGFLAAENEYIVFTDSDLAYGLDIVREFVSAMEKDEKCGGAIGSRSLHKEGYGGYGFIRRFASKTFLFFLKFAGGLKFSDSQTGIKGFKHRQAKEIFNACEENRWAFDFELLLTAQALDIDIIEIPVKIINHRDSKVSLLKDSFKMAGDLIKIKKKIKTKKLGQ